MSPRERAKRAQGSILRASQHPLLPADARQALGEVAVLIGEWGDLLEGGFEALAQRMNQLERKIDKWQR